MPSQAPIQAHKNTTGRLYKGLLEHAAAGLHGAVMERILADGAKPGCRILELGCGSGALTRRLVEHGFNVTAVDISLDTYGAPAEALEMDLNREFADLLGTRQFDLIIAIEVIEHLENPQHFLREAGRLMGSGTRLWVSFPNMYLYFAALSFLRDTSFVNWNVHQYWNLGHQTLLTDWLFRQHVLKAGLDVEADYFVAPVALGRAHGNPVKRMASRAVLGLLRLLTPGVSRQKRMADCVLFKIGGGSRRAQAPPPTPPG